MNDEPKFPLGCCECIWSRERNMSMDCRSTYGDASCRRKGSVAELKRKPNMVNDIKCINCGCEVDGVIHRIFARDLNGEETLIMDIAMCPDSVNDNSNCTTETFNKLRLIQVVK